MADRLLQCVLLNRLFKTFAESLLVLHTFLYQLVIKFLQQLLEENILHSHGFLSEIYLQTQYG